MSDKIKIKGARVHNLKNINIEIPKNKLVVITGLSGSGKSSLAFDTIYAEGQRRYAESLSSYARQFMEVRDKPEVDKIEGLSPTIAIDQKVSVQNPRSTVGTVTEIYDYLRLLFARAGSQYCPDCGELIKIYSPGEIAEEARKLARKNTEILIFSPLFRQKNVEIKDLLNKVEQSGLCWVRINGELVKINNLADYKFDKNKLYDADLLVERITNIKKQDVYKPVEIALDLSNGLVVFSIDAKKDCLYSTAGLCQKCGKILPILDVRSFSFNSPYGACQRCTGLGVNMEVDENLVVPNPRLTLAEGAIQPWTRITGNHNGYQKILEAVSKKYGFSMDMPLEQFSPQNLKIIMQGTGEMTYEVEGKKTVYEGVIKDLTDRHLHTNSEYVRREIEQYMREKVCSACCGHRLRAESLAVKINDFNIADLSALSIDQSQDIFKNKIGPKFKGSKIVEPIVREILPRLNNLSKVGLGYLSIDRAMNTLSGGEVTRVRLASQLSSGLTGVIYILDEPSVGLHPKDTGQLINTLYYLRDLGNTVIVVEHDATMMKAADYLVDVGPGAGTMGGEIVVAGTLTDIKKKKNSLTSQYLFGHEEIKLDRKQNSPSGSVGKSLEIFGARAFNLKNIDAKIPLGKLVCVTGVSGSGKSTLIVEVLAKTLAKHFYRAKEEPGIHKEIKGLENIDKVISIDQVPIGRTPRSNPATYTGIFTLIRDLFSNLPEAKMRGYDAGKFSFNVKGGGRCEACAGEGYIRIPMQFLADVFVECNECAGSRYNQESLEVHYRNKNISNVLRMTVEEAYRFFNDIQSLSEKLNVLREVGLGYLELGQPATTLSGGEAQRIKLTAELARVSTGRTLYILDEPTTGLHFDDIKRLLDVLMRLVDKGNTVLIIEHNLDVIRSADWIMELGPEGGDKGGELIFSGLPKDIKKNKKSWTAKYL